MDKLESLAREETPLGKRIVKACGGAIHDGKAERIAVAAVRALDLQDFARRLAAGFPSLTKEHAGAIVAVVATERGWGG